MNRIDHILAHTSVNPEKSVHTVFNVQGDDALNLVDQAWLKHGASVPGDPSAFIIPMGRVVGTAGDTSIRVVVKIDEKGLINNNIITAYPQ